jgi:hypothetical protein
LREGTARFDGLMLATISHQQHPIIPMETFDELVHLSSRGKRRLVEHIQPLLSGVGLRPFRKVTLESRGLHAGLSKLVCRARCRRKPLNPVALRFGTLTDDSERRCLSSARTSRSMFPPFAMSLRGSFQNDDNAAMEDVVNTTP